MDILSLLYAGSTFVSNVVATVANGLSILRSFGVPI